MKSNPPNENDAPLRAVLREWQTDAPLPPRFQEQVWQRIAREEAPASATLWQLFARRVEALFNRPVLAVSYIAVLLVAGLATGYSQAQVKSAHTAAQYRARYVQSIDPYQPPHN